MSLADEVVERSLAARQETYAAELRQLIEATYRVIADTGDATPPVRAILAEAGLSNPAFYRHFRSKDELFLVMLDEGRRQLATYLEHRAAAVEGRDNKVEAWVRGVFAQAVDPDAARRTRPFIADTARLQTMFPEEQKRSETALIDQLAVLLGDVSDRAPIVYALVFGAMGRHLLAAETPTESDIDAVVQFVLAGISA